MQTWIDLPFADGRYLFKIGLQQIAELERKCDAGIGRIFARTRKGRYGFEPGEALPDDGEYRWSELVEIIRQALIGGGEGVVDGNDVRVSPVRANDLVDAYLLGATDKRMIGSDVWALAYTIMHALIEGYTPPPNGAAGESPAASMTGSITTEPSTTAP